jgi:hypothetical protein
LRFENVYVRAPGAGSLGEVGEAVSSALAPFVAAALERPLVVRLIIRGARAAAALLSEPVTARSAVLRRAAHDAGRAVFVDEIWAEIEEPPGGLFRIDG